MYPVQVLAWKRSGNIALWFRNMLERCVRLSRYGDADRIALVRLHDPTNGGRANFRMCDLALACTVTASIS